MKVLAIGAAAGGAIWFTVAPGRTPPEYVSTVRPAVSASPSSTFAPTASPSPSPTAGETAGPTAGTPVLALVVGDGFSTTPEKSSSFACEGVRLQGWECVNEAGAGSGYISQGRGGTYAEQLGQGASRRAEVGLVVISGGAVDRNVDPAQLRVAVVSTALRATDLFPQAQIVVLAPFPVGGDATPALVAASSTLQSRAQAGVLRYVDTSNWFADVEDVLGDDGRSLTPGALDVATGSLAVSIPSAGELTPT